MTNSANPDQLASWLLQKPTDPDLHCLLRQGMSCLAREGLTKLNDQKCAKKNAGSKPVDITRFLHACLKLYPYSDVFQCYEVA